MNDTATPTEIVDYLTFVSYAHNRDLTPEKTPAQWAMVYGAEAVERMEPIYKAQRWIK